MRKLALPLLVVSMFLLMSGCAGCFDNSEEARQACEDIADALADKADECGVDREEFREAFLEELVDGDCGNVDFLEDRDLFYNECLPGIDEMTCTELEDGEVPHSCENQLGHYE